MSKLKLLIYCVIYFSFPISSCLSSMPNGTSKSLVDLFQQGGVIMGGQNTTPAYSSINVRGGNSKFAYFPPNNYREIFVYTMPQLSVPLMNLDLGSILSKEILKIDVNDFALTKKIKDMEMAALGKGIFTICKWAFKVPINLVTKFQQCTPAELKSALEGHE